MATLASEMANPEATAVWPQSETCEAFRLPLLPWEDVYLHVKRIDNSRLERPADPAAGRVCWRALRAAALVLAWIIVILLPDALGRVAGQRLVVLEKQRQELLEQRAQLDLEEASLLSPARLEEWARSLELDQPAPDQLLLLNPKPDRALSVRARPR